MSINITEEAEKIAAQRYTRGTLAEAIVSLAERVREECAVTCDEVAAQRAFGTGGTLNSFWRAAAKSCAIAIRSGGRA